MRDLNILLNKNAAWFTNCYDLEMNSDADVETLQFASFRDTSYSSPPSSFRSPEVFSHVQRYVVFLSSQHPLSYPDVAVSAMRMGRRWLPFLPRKSDLCAVVAASPAVSYEHSKQGLGGDDGEWRSYKRYARGKRPGRPVGSVASPFLLMIWGYGVPIPSFLGF